MKNIERILIATDFSPASQSALDYAVEWKNKLGASLTVIYIFDHRFQSALYSVYSEMLDNSILVYKEQLELSLKGLSEKIGADDYVFREGIPANEVAQCVNEKNIDLVIVGTHGYSGLEKLVLGSTAKNILYRVKCPVLTIKG